MKYLRRSFPVLALLVILLAFPIIAQAAPAHVTAMQEQETAPLSDLLTTFGSMTGVALMISILLNALKTAGVVKDGQAPAWSAGLNLFALVGLFVAQVAGYSNYVPTFDKNVGDLAVVVNVVIGYAFQLFVSRASHENIFAGIPVIGKSNTGRVAGAGPETTIEISSIQSEAAK